MNHQVSIAIGGLPISITCGSRRFIAMLERRYGNFIMRPRDRSARRAATSMDGECASASIQLEIDVVSPSPARSDEELAVGYESGRWVMHRGDFRAEWDPASERGTVRQAAYPYAIDSVIRIVLSLILARSGGFLLHSASAVRGGRAFLFSGVSGAGKTTIARLAPPDAILLTDEITCVRRSGTEYHAFGTPFAGELGIAGEEIAAPITALYFLRKGPRNRTDAIDPARAAAMLLRNILFFADDSELVKEVFATACDFAARVAVAELTFRPDVAVWELIA
jgi:hypothetical protein